MINTLPDQTMKFSEQVENIVRILKHGKREQVLFLLGLLCLASANLFPGFLSKIVPVSKSESFQSILQTGLNLLSIVPFLWGIIRVWKKAIPGKIEITETVKPSAIKGPFAFGEMDGKIFAQLGREADLSKLLSWVLDSQICFTALKGESGAGKTSLLRAGLVYTLEREKYGIQPVYWEARAENPVDDLLRAIHLACPAEKETLQSLETVIKTDCGARKVIIIDQAEQLSPEKHPEIFDFFRKIIARKPPYHTTWLIAFRDEYASTWFDFEATIPGFHPPKHSLKIFSEEQAQENMTVLARESGLTPDTAVLREMVNAMSDQGKVSPVEIGIGMMVLSELYAGPVHDVSLGSFRESGGVTGLLRTYIKDKFAEGIPAHEHSPMQNALLALIDPENPQQRLASGKTVSELAPIANLPANRMQHHLAYLAAQTVRLLEQLPGGTYRLAHERLISALESLVQGLVAAAEQAKHILYFNFKAWSRTKQEKFLLSRGELRKIIRLKKHFHCDLAPEVQRYLSVCKRQHFWEFGLILIIPILMLFLVLFSSPIENYVIKPLERRSEVKKQQKIHNNLVKQLKEQSVLLKEDVFEMGSIHGQNDEKPLHSVRLDSFYITKYEITNQQYCDFLNSHDSAFTKVNQWLNLSDIHHCKILDEGTHFEVQKRFKNFPVVSVSWYGANAFTEWVGGRLPTEAEWEYACRASTNSPFNTGDSLFYNQANYKGNYWEIAVPVGRYPPNSWGIFDMHGNVWEWCQDWYDEKYYDKCKQQRVVENPTGPETGSNRVLRGGGWSRIAQHCRSAYRYGSVPGARDADTGFRLVFVP